MIGTVTSDKMNKTVVVAVETSRNHRLYGRTIRRTHKFKAHDERNQCHNGDLVEIRESRPLSREKHWVVARLLKSGQEDIPIADPTAPTSQAAS
jgi:small subunit ribosomal protein S17